MTTLMIQDDIYIQKTSFVNIYELYEYIEEKYIWADLQFTHYEDLNEFHKKEYNKSLDIDKTKLVNI